MLTPWEKLPKGMQIPEVKLYYEILKKKEGQLKIKRVIDVFLSIFLIVLLCPSIILISLLIRFGSPGPVIFRQIRVTKDDRHFEIWKFRTMVNDAESIGGQLTSDADPRITVTGAVLRKYHLDEIPQIFNVLMGDMSFVGVRPEVPYYVKQYTREMRATLLLPAGITSDASIFAINENEMLAEAENADEIDEIYMNKVLPAKMEYNLEYIRNFSIIRDILVVIKTVIAVIRS